MSDFLDWMVVAQDGMVLAAEWPAGLFRKRVGTLLNWITSIVSLVLMLLIAMNSPIALIRGKYINKLVTKAGCNVISRYLILPWIGTFFLINPITFIPGRFLPEVYKPGYYVSVAQMVYTNNGLSPHNNLGGLFVWVGIVRGTVTLQSPTGDLAIRYLLLGVVLNFFSGWVTDFATAYVAKQ